ncbi:MAG: T9SS type A sorting domain-containing protein [Flavobacteriaceae bacterium]|nr:T9SS type A sorting domain-containing protein [Flavobacteriaceae bacterium]
MSSSLLAQDFSDTWVGLFSFFDVKALDVSGSKIYVAAENAVFIYDNVTNEIETITTVNGLSGQLLTSIHRSDAFGLLVLGYENGLMEIVIDDDPDILKIIDIRDKVSIAPNRKRINHFEENGDILVVSSDFGVSEYNLANLEFGDTFFIGPGGQQVVVNSAAFFGGFLWAATNQGLFRADALSPNLVDFDNWTLILSGSIQHSIVFDNQLRIIQGNALFTYNGANFVNSFSFGQAFRNAKVNANTLAITLQNSVVLLNAALNPITLSNFADVSNNFTDALSVGNEVFIGSAGSGVLKVLLNNPSIAEIIVEPGPLLNRPFGLKSAPGNLWVMFGEHSQSMNPFPLNRLGLSRLKEDTWINYTFDEVLSAINLISATIDPNNPNKVFVSSYFNGLIEFEDESIVNFYTSLNSTLEGLNSTGPDTDIRLTQSAFDTQGNLWMLNNRIVNGLKVLQSNGQWSQIDLSQIIPNPVADLGFQKIVIDNNNNIYFGSFSNGVVGYNIPTASFINFREENADLINNFVPSLALDQRNQLWIGNILGLRVIFNPASAFAGSTPQAQPIIIIDENGVPQELLSDENIIDIVVDGRNNKWIATGNSGAFYLSPNGTQTLFHFTADNSPLPTNQVIDIEIDDTTGKVFFATTRGIVAFTGIISAPPSNNLDNLRAFPNPVRPGFDGNVVIDGLTDRARVKIVDVSGNLVFEEVSQGGAITWDTTAFGKHRVASGVYIVLASTEDGIETNYAKILIVR